MNTVMVKYSVFTFRMRELRNHDDISEDERCRLQGLLLKYVWSMQDIFAVPPLEIRVMDYDQYFVDRLYWLHFSPGSDNYFCPYCGVRVPAFLFEALRYDGMLCECRAFRLKDYYKFGSIEHAAYYVSNPKKHQHYMEVVKMEDRVEDFDCGYSAKNQEAKEVVSEGRDCTSCEACSGECNHESCDPEPKKDYAASCLECSMSADCAESDSAEPPCPSCGKYAESQDACQVCDAVVPEPMEVCEESTDTPDDEVDTVPAEIRCFACGEYFEEEVNQTQYASGVYEGECAHCGAEGEHTITCED